MKTMYPRSTYVLNCAGKTSPYIWDARPEKRPWRLEVADVTVNNPDRSMRKTVCGKSPAHDRNCVQHERGSGETIRKPHETAATPRSVRREDKVLAVTAR